MSLKVAVQMDPIERINIKGDSTFALLLEAQKRGHGSPITRPTGWRCSTAGVFATVETLSVRDSRRRPFHARRAAAGGA